MNNGNINNLKPVTLRSKEEARELSRKGGKASGIARRAKKERNAAMLALLNVAPLTKADADMIDRALLSLNKNELLKIANNNKYPQDVCVRAALLASDDKAQAMEMAERMRDRVFGKPKQAVDVAVDNTPPASIIEVTMSEE